MSSPDPIRPPPWAAGVEPAPPAARWGPPVLDRPGPGGPTAPREPADPAAQAYERGLAEGFQLGQEQAAAGLQPVHELMARVSRELEREQLVARRNAEQNVTALAVAVARWLFQREVALDPGIVQQLVRRAVHLLPTTSMIEIRAHPDDLEAMSAHLQITEADGRPLPVHWIADGILERGDFMIATPERLVDGRADVALRSLYERLASD